jgi:hypothetical protein
LGEREVRREVVAPQAQEFKQCSTYLIRAEY